MFISPRPDEMGCGCFKRKVAIQKLGRQGDNRDISFDAAPAWASSRRTSGVRGQISPEWKEEWGGEEGGRISLFGLFAVNMVWPSVSCRPFGISIKRLNELKKKISQKMSRRFVLAVGRSVEMRRDPRVLRPLPSGSSSDPNRKCASTSLRSRALHSEIWRSLLGV
jgi:hypothetical protein